jgi:carbonic anhydrase/acetyltransferase-like protein (isoleucine patch superfamily)
MAVYRLGDDLPRAPGSAYIAESATVIGKVILGEQVSVWPGAVIRGDNDQISLGDGTNVQDNAVLHADAGFPLSIGRNVTVGHQATLHGCTIGDGCLIGIRAVVMNGAVIGKDCLIGAGALISEGKIFAERKLILGAPAKVARDLRDDEVENMHRAAASYAQRQAMYQARLKRIE